MTKSTMEYDWIRAISSPQWISGVDKFKVENIARRVLQITSATLRAESFIGASPVIETSFSEIEIASASPLNRQVGFGHFCPSL